MEMGDGEEGTRESACSTANPDSHKWNGRKSLQNTTTDGEGERERGKGANGRVSLSPLSLRHPLLPRAGSMPDILHGTSDYGILYDPGNWETRLKQ